MVVSARARHRTRWLLPALGLCGAALVVVFGAVLWRTLDLEGRARAAEQERAEAIALRILQLAPGHAAVHAALPAGRRAVLRDGALVIDPEVGWVLPEANPLDRDPVVDDRLDRAAVAEFGAKDLPAAERAFGELLAANLPATQRWQVLAAAAWFRQRRGDLDGMAALRQELETALAAVQPAELARPALAQVVAATLRLPREVFPAWAERLWPALPEEVVAGIQVPPGWAAAQAAAVARRGMLRQLASAWRTAATAPGALRDLGPDELLSIRRDGASGELAVATPAEWFAAVQAAGRDGALPVWPWALAPVWSNDPAEATAGVPFLRGLAPSVGPELASRPWVLPGLAGGLLALFAAGLSLQVRASRREAAAVRAEAEFLTTVTHELKTPLASIRLLGEMLLEGRARGREPDYYRMLAGEAARLSMLIENVLDLGRVERGARNLERRPVDVGEVVAETAELLRPLGGELRVQAVAACFARTDRSALVQALVALIDNARKYGAPPVDLRVQPIGGRVVIDLEDRGPGVPEAERERIFERFVRGAAQAHGSTPGVGIGLYLARTMLRRLGGDLVCGPRQDGGPGAGFRLWLPSEETA